MAKNGTPGQGSQRNGADGEDLYVSVPQGERLARLARLACLAWLAWLAWLACLAAGGLLPLPGGSSRVPRHCCPPLGTTRTPHHPGLPPPPGTIIRRRDAEEDEAPLAELLEPGQVALLVAGGRGGRGNASFKTQKNKAPALAERGEAGNEMWVQLELKVRRARGGAVLCCVGLRGWCV